MANGNDLVPGGMGLDPGVSTAVPLSMSPDIDASLAADRMTDNRYRNIYNPLAPSFSPFVQAAQAAQAPETAATPTNFDMAFGDSIAGQQIHSNIPGVGAGRMWGWLGPQYDAKNPAPFDIWHTAGVGDPPSRIRERAIHAVEQNSDFFRNKNVFLPIGSNVEGPNPDHVTGIDAVKDMLSMLDGSGVGSVVIPGVGPGVKNGAAWNTAVQKVVGDMNDPRFVFFQPQVNWAKDGVHPNSQQMFDQANAALNQALPQTASDPTAPQAAPASLTPQPPGSAPPNALTPPEAQQAAYTGPHADIYNHALYHGVDPELALTAARIESNFDPNANLNKPSQYKGVFQLGNEEWKSMGGTDANRWDPTAQVNLGVSLLAQRQQQLADRIGRTPANWEVYMAHQQGVSGFATMAENPDMNAAEAAQKAAGGKISLDEARKRIQGNGGNPDGTAGEFLQTWQNKYEHFKGEIGDTPAYAGSPVVPGHYGYTSGQSVPNSPYAVGGRVAGMVPQPQPNPLGLPPSMSLPDLVAGATREAVKPVQQLADQERKFRALQMMSIIGGMFKGHKFVPVDYDPWAVAHAGEQGGGGGYNRSLGTSVGGVGAGTGPMYGQYKEFSS